jgi:hypothetical protein
VTRREKGTVNVERDEPPKRAIKRASGPAEVVACSSTAVAFAIWTGPGALITAVLPAASWTRKVNLCGPSGTVRVSIVMVASSDGEQTVYSAYAQRAVRSRLATTFSSMSASTSETRLKIGC